MLDGTKPQRKPCDPVLRSYANACRCVGLQELADLFVQAAAGDREAAVTASNEWRWVGASLRSDIDEIADQMLAAYERAGGR